MLSKTKSDMFIIAETSKISVYKSAEYIWEVEQVESCTGEIILKTKQHNQRLRLWLEFIT